MKVSVDGEQVLLARSRIERRMPKIRQGISRKSVLDKDDISQQLFLLNSLYISALYVVWKFSKPY